MTPTDPPEERGPGDGPPVPPDDRLWRHPSEVGWGAGMAAVPVAPPHHSGPPAGSKPAPTRGRVRSSLLVGGSMLLGAGFALLGTYAVGLLDQPDTEVVERVEQPLVSSLGGDALEAALHEQVLPAVARLEARRPSGRTNATAIVFRSDGHLLTTSDAVAGADSVAVTLADGRSLDATVVGTDPVTDLAVVKVDATSLPTVLLGSVRDLQLGEPVYAIDAGGAGAGAPAVTGGVISALGDRVDTDDQGTLHDMITTNTGSPVATPGSAVVDTSGAVIGIATARRESGAVPVGTDAPVTRSATPIEYARAVASDLIDEGTVRHVWLGIDGEVRGPAVPGRGVAAPGGRSGGAGDGAPVVAVEPGGPAEEAGLQAGDVVSGVGDVRVTDLSSLVASLRSHRPGDRIELTIERDGTRSVVPVTLEERPAL